MVKCILTVSGPLALVLMAGGCMGRDAGEAQVGRALMMPQSGIAVEAATGPATGPATGLAAGLATGVAVPGALPESCAAGGWRARLLDKRDAVLARADLPAGHRVLHPGDLMTAEVNPQRMTVTVNSKGKIDNVYCG